MDSRKKYPRSLLAAVLLAACMAQPAAANEPVDINTATAEQLAAAISGVGLKRAQAIVAYRTEHGPFRSIDELANVSGIGDATIARSRERLNVQ